MTPEIAVRLVAQHWRMPFDNWHIGVHRLLARFG